MGQANDPAPPERNQQGAAKPPQNGENTPFWKSIPGIITTVTGLIVALTTLVGLLAEYNIIGGPTDTPTAVAVLPLDTPVLLTPTDSLFPSATVEDILTPVTATETPVFPTATLTLTPTETLSAFNPTATFYPGEPFLAVLAWPGLNIRRGPGYDFPYGPAISTLPYGTTVRILGRNATGDWYQIECPVNVNSESGCWVVVDEEFINAFFALELPTIVVPPTITGVPTMTSTPTVTPTAPG
jgi:hypothetical protein